MIKFRRTMLLVVAALFSTHICFAKTPQKEINLESLEGRWKVISTTWGGDPDDFLQGIYQFKFIKKPTETKSGQVQFVVAVDSGKTVYDFDNSPFCGMQYDKLPDNLTLYNGYPHLYFWEFPEYPCGISKAFSENDDQEDSYMTFSGPKYLLRLKIINPEKISAIVYYEFGFGGAAVESSFSEGDKKDETTKCKKTICITQDVAGTGIFELTLKKISKWEEMKEGLEE